MKYFLFFSLLSLFMACEPAAEKDAISHSEPLAPMKAETPDSLLRHVVLFSFLEDSYPAGVADVEAAFRALPGKIPEIRDFEWGTNNSPEGLDKGYTHIFFVTFKSETDREIYLPHPDHQAFVEVLKPHLKNVLVLDYWSKE